MIRFLMTRSLTAGLAALAVCGCTSPAPETRASEPEATYAGPPPRTLPRSPYTFEAERAAMGKGCLGPGQTRPAAQLMRRSGSLEWFEVSCANNIVMRVRCDTGMCVAVN